MLNIKRCSRVPVSILHIFWIFGGFLVGAGETSAASQANSSARPMCRYRLPKASASIEWTAFKTTEKLGVKGTLKEIQVKAPETFLTFSETLEAVQAELNGMSVDSGNAARDENLKKGFFPFLADKAQIRTRVNKVTGNDQKGALATELTFNGVSKELVWDYRVSEK